MPESTFRMTTAFRHGRTKVDDLYFEAPFKLMTPFHHDAHTDCMVMLASPGFLKGDIAHINCTFGAGTDTTMQTQSYEKVLDTADGEAKRTIDLTVQGDAKAVFLPFPVIPFAHSTFSNVTTAHISPESTFVYADVVTCGRVGMGEIWRMRRFSNTLRIYVDYPDDSNSRAPHRGRPRNDAGQPIPRLAFADRLLLEPERFDYTEMAMWREYTHCGMAYIHLPQQGGQGSGIRGDEQTDRTAAEDALIADIRGYAEDHGFHGELGVSRQVNGIAVRLLTARGDEAFDFISDVAGLVR